MYRQVWIISLCCFLQMPLWAAWRHNPPPEVQKEEVTNRRLPQQRGLTAKSLGIGLCIASVFASVGWLVIGTVIWQWVFIALFALSLLLWLSWIYAESQRSGTGLAAPGYLAFVELELFLFAFSMGITGITWLIAGLIAQLSLLWAFGIAALVLSLLAILWAV